MGNKVRRTILKVKNWGPVTEGQVLFKPLTIFIGPNNAGKSYTVMLYYAILRGLKRALRAPYPGLDIEEIFLSITTGFPLLIKSERLQGLVNVIKEITFTKEKLSTKTYEKFVREIKNLLKGIVVDTNKRMERSKRIIEEEIERVFSSRIVDLIRKDTGTITVELRIEGRFLCIEYLLKASSERSHSEVSLQIIDEDKLSEKLVKSLLKRIKELKRVKQDEAIRHFIVRCIIPPLLEEFNELLGKELYYLPASRAGILHSYRTVARAMIEAAPLAPIRGTEIPRMPGPVADFLGFLIEIMPERSVTWVISPNRYEKSREIAEEIENSLLEGKVELIRDKLRGMPELVYKHKELEIPMSRASSMIAEASALDLSLKRGLEEGDILIIEEPEAHLHPEKQVRIADFLVKLVRELGVNIRVTTHSDLILARLSNLISMSFLPHEEREKGVFTIKPDEVSVYCFKRKQNGAIIQPVSVTEEGIPDDEFKGVIEELYEQTMRLYLRIQELKAESGA